VETATATGVCAREPCAVQLSLQAAAELSGHARRSQAGVHHLQLPLSLSGWAVLLFIACLIWTCSNRCLHRVQDCCHGRWEGWWVWFALPSWCWGRAFQQWLILALPHHQHRWQQGLLLLLLPRAAMRCGPQEAQPIDVAMDVQQCWLAGPSSMLVVRCISVCYFMPVRMQQSDCQVSHQEGVRNVSAGAVHPRKHWSHMHCAVQHNLQGTGFGVIAEVLGQSAAASCGARSWWVGACSYLTL